ncbi:MAG: rRNA adenine N-6-methyltransferase family protein [Verrucomicrobiota bacterium]
MSLLFFKRVLANPLRVGYLVPSSPFLTRQTASHLDYSRPRVIVELGPGEGCHTREIVKRMGPDSRLVLFEVDPEFVTHLRHQFQDDDRVTVLQTDALHIREALDGLGHTRCDYILSGIPFSVIEKSIRKRILSRIAGAMDANSRFIAYQLGTQLCEENHLFELAKKTFCAMNLPPINVMEFRRAMTN